MSTTKQDYIREMERVKKERERLDNLYPQFRERRTRKPRNTWKEAGYTCTITPRRCPICEISLPPYGGCECEA